MMLGGGVDVGSTQTKAVIVGASRRIVARATVLGMAPGPGRERRPPRCERR